MLSLFYVEFRRSLMTLIRYPVNFTAHLFINVFMFYGLYLGSSYMSGKSSFGETLNIMVVGYTAWVLVSRSFAKVPQLIEAESSTGVLESVFLSRFPTSVIYVVRGFVEAIIDMVMIVILVNSIIWLTKANVIWTWSIAFPVLTIFCASIGLSVLAGGFAVKLKRISAILPLIQFSMMFLMFVPFKALYEQGNLLVMALPMVPSVVMLRELMVHDMSFNVEMAMIAAANGFIYLVAGAIIFHMMVTQARAKGLVGGY